MTIDLTCQKCDASFELDAADLIEGNETIKCPNCSAKAPQTSVDDFSSALGELAKQIHLLRKKFGLSLALETDDLPAPYDNDETPRRASADEDEEEDDEEDVGEDEDELDEDGDEELEEDDDLEREDEDSF